MPAPPDGRRAGFTLIELSVAMTIGLLVILSARSLTAGIMDGARRAGQELAVTAGEGNGRQRLVMAAAGLDVATAGAQGFNGAPSRVEFSTWLRGPHGSPELSRARITAADHTLWLTVNGDRVRLLENVDGLAIDYLLTPGARSFWVRGWVSATSPPLALRLRLTRPSRTDTLLLLIGERG